MPTPAASAFLGPPQTAGYRPAVYGRVQSLVDGQRDWFTWSEVEAMRRDPDIRFGLAILKGPLRAVTWQVAATSPDVSQFVDATYRRFWREDLDKALQFLEYGHSAGELTFRVEGGKVVYAGLHDLHPRDCRPLVGATGLRGVCVASGVAASGSVNLWGPRGFWAVYRPRFGGWYGQGRYEGCFLPWREANGRHGGKDIRRLWFLKNAFDGGTMYHPMGSVDLGDGQVRSNQDYARELVEKKDTGGVLALPNAVNPATGQKEWEYVPPKPNGDIGGVREYCRDLADEKLTGMEIPVEVVRAAETGSGWSGRSVPFLVFLAGEDEIVATVVRAVDRWLRPLVKLNFGDAADYTVEPGSLVKLAQDHEEAQAATQRAQSQPPAARLSHGGNDPRPLVISDRVRRRALRAAARRAS